MDARGCLGAVEWEAAMVCGQRLASDFPRHNDLIENGHRKVMFLGYDVVSPLWYDLYIGIKEMLRDC